MNSVAQGLRVLVAEDEPHIARLIEFKLQKEGFSVTLARDGLEAKRHLHEALAARPDRPWDVIILDVMMPGCDGWEVLREVRSLGRLSQVPVLMLTARGQASDPDQAQSLGATRLLRKPFDPSELVRVLQELGAPQ